MNFGNKLKQLKYENLWAFIRSDVHAVRAGMSLRGSRPLTTPVSGCEGLKKARLLILVQLIINITTCTPLFKPIGDIL